jgi:hypothetical protein
MQEMATVAAKALAQGSLTKDVAETSTFEPLNEETIDKFFMKMKAIYANKFTCQFNNEDPELARKALRIAKATWSEGLAGLSLYQIRRGFARSQKIADWNPNIPEFLRLATGLPTKGECIERVAAGRINDPVSLAVITLIGSFTFSRATTDENRRAASNLYLEAYEAVLDEVIGIEGDWAMPLAIEQKEEPVEPWNPDVSLGESHLEKMRKNC